MFPSTSGCTYALQLSEKNETNRLHKKMRLAVRKLRTFFTYKSLCLVCLEINLIEIEHSQQSIFGIFRQFSLSVEQPVDGVHRASN